MNHISVNESNYGMTISAEGGGRYTLTMSNGLTYTVEQESWNLKHDYYLEIFVHSLSEIIQNLQQNGNSLKRVAELATGRGTLSIGVALLTDEDTRVISCDIEEQVAPLVYKNAAANQVRHKIEVRIGDLLDPLETEEPFDLILFEMPFAPLDPAKEPYYKKQGYFAELLHVCGGADGRYFIDRIVSQSNHLLNPGGAILWVQPSFIGVDQSLSLLAQNGFEGQVVAEREWLLRDTKYTLENKEYIEKISGGAFAKNAQGEDIYSLVVIQGVKQ